MFIQHAKYLVINIYLKTTNFDYKLQLDTYVFLFSKKTSFRPQNGFGSSGPEKLPKIVNCATIKEIEKLKETMVGLKLE